MNFCSCRPFLSVKIPLVSSCIFILRGAVFSLGVSLLRCCLFPSLGSLHRFNYLRSHMVNEISEQREKKRLFLTQIRSLISFALQFHGSHVGTKAIFEGKKDGKRFSASNIPAVSSRVFCLPELFLSVLLFPPTYFRRCFWLLIPPGGSQTIFFLPIPLVSQGLFSCFLY